MGISQTKLTTDDPWERPVKCVCVGDEGVGKTCMIISYFRDEFPSAYVPTVLKNCTARVNIDNSSISLDVWDTTERDEYVYSRTPAWSNADVFIVCYSIGEPTSLDNVAKKWLPEIRRLCANAPFLLVGTKADLRSDKKLSEDDTLADFGTAGREGQEHRAACVMECSALTGVGLREVFDKATRVALTKRYGSEQLPVATNAHKVPPQMRPMPMWHAANQDNTEELARLLNNPDNDPNVTDIRGRTPLMRAALAGSEKCVVMLTEDRRVHLDQKDLDGKTALDFAKEKNIEAKVKIERVLSKRGDPNASDEVFQNKTAIGYVLREGCSYLSLVRTLIEAKASANAPIHEEVTEIVNVTPAGESATWTHPFNTHRKRRRTQTMYLASDMRAGGLSRGFTITKLQLKFSTKPALPLQYMTVQYALTSGVLEQGWYKTTLCHGPCTLTPDQVQIGANAWTEFVLTKPIQWEGVSNLVLRFSFNNDDTKDGGLVHCVRTSIARSKFLKSSKGSNAQTGGNEKKVPCLRLVIQVQRQQTPLTWAIKAKDVALIRMLADAGADPTLTDAQGISGTDLGATSSNMDVRTLVKRMGRFCGRYKLDTRPEHNTSTSVVYLATDLEGQRKAIKFSSDKFQFETEVRSREGLDARFVVPVFHHSGKDLDDFASAAAKIGLGNHPHGMVMEAADRNLAVIRLQEHPTLAEIVGLMYQVAQALHHLHQRGVLHGDVKPLNIVRTSTRVYKLIDLDAAARISLDRAGRKYSSAFVPPEGMRAIIGLQSFPVAHPSWDVFSFGAMLFELLTSTPLLPRNSRTDNIEALEFKRMLCLWHGPTPGMLDKIRNAKLDGGTPDALNTVCHLVEWCLQDAENRPTMAQILEHRVFNPGVNELQLSDPRGDGRFFPSWHMFISHMQIQSNGEAARLAQMIEYLGGMPWLDMKATNLTQEGMKHGVLNSKVFVLLLTSDVLTRPFCLLEIKTAIDGNIPIIILREEDKRFFPWSFEEWKSNRMWDRHYRKWVRSDRQNASIWEKQTMSDGTVVWVDKASGKAQLEAPPALKGNDAMDTASSGPYANMAQPLGNPADSLHFSAREHLQIRDTIEAHKDEMLTIRRRHFEVEALVREIFRRIDHRMPDDAPLVRLPGIATMTLACLFAPGVPAAGGGEDMANALQAAVEAAGAKWSVDSATATHIIILLTGGLLATPALASQVSAVLGAGRQPFIFLYSETHGWDFTDTKRSEYPEIDKAVNSHEAMCYRAPTPAHLRFEHEAMVREMLHRMTKQRSK